MQKNVWLLPIWVALCCLVMAGNSSIVAAQTVRDDDYESLINESTFYDIVPLGNCGTAADGEGITLQGKDNIQKGFNFFIAKGLTPAQSAGIIGNLRQESGANIMNPASHNTAAPRVGNPGAIIPGETWYGGGIAQWEGGRWTGNNGFLNFVAGKGAFAGKPQGDGKNWKVLSIQLDYIWWELTHTEKNALDHLKTTTTVAEATRSFVEKYERAGTPALANRIKYAQETLDAFGGLTPDNVAPSGACGGDGITIDGYSFPVAPQTQRGYGSLPCSSSNSASRSVNYTPSGGSSVRILTCHHDNTPAFDLMYDGVAGKPIYAITEGIIIKVNRSYVMNSGAGGKPCGSIQFQSTNGKESTFYWYGHILPGPDVSVGKKFGGEGQPKQLGTVATQDFGPKCWGGGPHLHIDRGCIVGTTPKQGGNDGCRDPQFLQDLQKIWEGLPASS